MSGIWRKVVPFVIEEHHELVSTDEGHDTDYFHAMAIEVYRGMTARNSRKAAARGITSILLGRHWRSEEVAAVVQAKWDARKARMRHERETAQATGPSRRTGRL